LTNNVKLPNLVNNEKSKELINGNWIGYFYPKFRGMGWIQQRIEITILTVPRTEKQLWIAS